MDQEKLIRMLDEPVIETIDLGAFHERLQGETIDLRMDFPRERLKEIDKIEDLEEQGLQRFAMQTGYSLENARALFSKDAPFCAWLTRQIVERNRAYGAGRTKKSSTG